MNLSLKSLLVVGVVFGASSGAYAQTPETTQTYKMPPTSSQVPDSTPAKPVFRTDPNTTYGTGPEKSTATGGEPGGNPNRQ